MGLLYFIISEYGSAIIIALIVLFVVRRSLKHVFGKSKVPPGPLGVPILGYLPFMAGKEPFYKTLTNLADKYGDVYMIQMGGQTCVMLNSVSSIEEAFKMDVFSGRPSTFSFNMIKDAGENALIFAEGPKWRFNRKVAFRALNLFSASKDSGLDETNRVALNWLIKKIDEANGEPIKTKSLLVPCTGSIISSLCFGHDPNPDDPFFNELVKLTYKFLEVGQTIQYIDFVPFTRHFLKSKIKEMISSLNSFVQHVRRQINKHLETVDIENVTDIATAIERIIEDTPESERAEIQTPDDDIRGLAIDLFDGGFFTTAENTEWLLLLAAYYPDMQMRLYEEIRENVAKGEYPTAGNDLPNLTYCKAFVQKSLRFSSNIPMSLGHRCTGKVMFRNYFIPEDAQMMGNIWAVNHDPGRFKDPFTFNPDRFLDENGDFSKTESEKVLTFSVGKRRCPGEALAKTQLPILLAGVVQNFELFLEPNTTPDPVENPSFQFTIAPGPHKLICKKR